MRKNNFLKIFVSLVMCLMLVLSLVACGGSGEKGEKGDKGDKGDAGVDGVGIADVTYEDGKLVINYTNDETDSFDIVAEAAACEHNYSEPVELVKHTIDAKGTYLTVCGECGAAALNADTIHNFETTEVAATCTAYGYTADKCACGYETNKVMGTELAAHNMTTQGYVALPGKTICVDGGTLLQYCTECKLTAQTETEGIGHKVEAYAIEKGDEPKIDRAGLLTGKCVQCDIIDEVSLPVLNADDYTVVVLKEKADCSDIGEANYIYAFNGQTFEIKGDIPAADHVLGGKPASEIAWVVDGETVYDANLPGIKFFAGEKAVCQVVVENEQAYYTCEKCGEAVAVKAYRCHAGVAVENSVPTPATCTTTGSQAITKCVYCEETNVNAVIPATGHHFAYNVETAVVNGKTVVKAINKECDNDCGEKETVSFAGEASYKELAVATCAVNGEAEITYKPYVLVCGKTEHKHVACNLSCTIEAHTHDENCYLTKKAITVKVATSLADHKLNGVFINDEANVDSTLAGVKLFAGNTLTNCGEVKPGYFMCDTCAEAVAVNVEKKHAVIAWSWDKDENGKELKPTCSADGVLTGECTACGNKVYDRESDAVKKTGNHELTYKFVKTSKANEYAMTYDCAGCDLPEYNSQEPEIVTGVTVNEIASTCSVQGTKTYSYKDEDGKYVTAVEKLPLAKHTLNGEAVKLDVLDYDLVAGLKLFAGVDIECGNTVNGYFFCEVCDEAVSVSVIKNHRGTWTWTEKDADGKIVVPTCHNDAERTMAECLDCGKKNIVERAPALDHVTDLKFNIEVLADGNLDGSVTVFCTLCEDVIVVKDIDEIEQFNNLTLKNAKRVVKATCKANGFATFVIKFADVEFTFDAVIAKVAHTAQVDLKSTSNIFVLSRVNEKEEVEYYAVYECATCGDFYVLENTPDFDFDSADKADVEKAIADFKAELKKTEDEKAAADAQ